MSPITGNDMSPKTLNLSQKTSDFDENANKTEANEELNRLQLISSSDHGNHTLPMSEHETTVFSRVSPVRGQCLIIQGLPESTASASKERVSADLQLFQCLLNKLLRPNDESPFTPPDCEFDEGPKIESVSFDEATVRKELMTLNESKSQGPDAIPPKLLKELAAELAKPLSVLFQASFEAGCLPADWKSARITALHKGGSKASANNYRPISLTSICCKLMEKIIKRELVRFLEQHNLLSDAQHGFRSGRSCVTNLLNCLERWTRSVEEGNALHVVYIDFKKAFDSVSHQRLLHKLSRTGVTGNLLKWIQSFLLDRFQTVHVGGQKLTEVAVESGVPQGSVLGPTLFIIYVNDCVSELDCGVAMFSDDIKLWSVIRTADDEEHLQANLNRLQQWSKAWLLPYNEKKCRAV
nr:unnamed protein product [Spirometra erinaceieuropaei]